MTFEKIKTACKRKMTKMLKKQTDKAISIGANEIKKIASEKIENSYNVLLIVAKLAGVLFILNSNLITNNPPIEQAISPIINNFYLKDTSIFMFGGTNK